ncbi:MAG TPA: ATP synthase F0 subunit B [Pyrinomonadaceae bacterium]|nr:ATP synthase F0 subunit B [Pyrinomonadaceae bacterium]
MLLFAADGGWFNYPGIEAWKFVNLTIFVVLGIIFLRKKINEGLLARREVIQQELVAAKAERDQALARVAEADSLLSRLDDDVRAVHEQSRVEAEQERQRLAAGTEREIEKLKQQAQREIERADKLARKELREYLAKRSIDLARESLRIRMRPEDDMLLIKESIGELRRTTV